MKFKSIFFCDEYDSKNCNPRSLYKPLDRNVKLRLKFWLMWQLQAYVAFQTLTQEPAYLFLWLIIADSFFVWQYFVPPIEWYLAPLSKHFFPPRECCVAPFSNYCYPLHTVLFWATEGSYIMLIWWHACEMFAKYQKQFYSIELCIIWQLENWIIQKVPIFLMMQKVSLSQCWSLARV